MAGERNVSSSARVHHARPGFLIRLSRHLDHPICFKYANTLARIVQTPPFQTRWKSLAASLTPSYPLFFIYIENCRRTDLCFGIHRVHYFVFIIFFLFFVWSAEERSQQLFNNALCKQAIRSNTIFIISRTATRPTLQSIQWMVPLLSCASKLSVFFSRVRMMYLELGWRLLIVSIWFETSL